MDNDIGFAADPLYRRTRDNKVGGSKQDVIKSRWKSGANTDIRMELSGYGGSWELYVGWC